MSALIGGYLDQLLRSFNRVAPPVDDSALSQLHARRDYPAMLGWIKNSMRLSLKVGLRIVNQEAPSPPMWIETPQRMPIYGTSEFERTRVTVNVRRDLLEAKPFAWVVAGFAHELSHVVLFSIGHALQHEEKAVDLTAMILGYQRFIIDAENTVTENNVWSVLLTIVMLPLGVLFWRGPSRKTHRLGYLTRTEAEFARRYLAQFADTRR
jgi:hypothetical protein